MNNTLRALVDLRDRQIQKARIQFGNRQSAIERQADETEGDQQKVVEKWSEVFQELEKSIDKDIKALVKDEPIFEYMSAIRGIGPMLSAKIIAMVDITRADTPSALWKYSGYGVGEYWQEDGKVVAPLAGFVWNKDKKCKEKVTPGSKPEWELVSIRDRPVEGFLLAYNKRLKITLRLVGYSFIKSNSPYRAIYDAKKNYYTETRQDWTSLHIHNAAMRKMIKVFLVHLWLKWRELEGLPIVQAYVHEVLRHDTVYDPKDFGW